MKKIAILGITGSIGTSAIEVIREHQDEFQIVLASSHQNSEKLFQLAEEFDISQIVLTNENLKISSNLENSKLYFGHHELQQLLKSVDCDIVLNAISGSAGLVYSDITISRNCDLALANKESLVMAGHILMNKVSNCKILPVDSEHSAILQSLGNAKIEEVESLILTASGGPFRDYPLNKFNEITLKQALSHPNWEMGKKITIDSATMMNKALEVIEAHWLFNVEFEKIKTVIHPQSIIHSFVEFVDGSIVSQMGFPTMKIPILFALTYPQHIVSKIAKTNILDVQNLSFEKVENVRYPLFEFAISVGREGGLLPTVLNAANEAAVQLFLDEKIDFPQINNIVQTATKREINRQNPNLEEIIFTNQEIYQKTLRDFKILI
ncbi:MAG: 1-deoxy-D-xylulose-5-phosphate reductoisomerase [Candidatus Cloacimonetes bacterium]|jgi:1-deoxy-D-xylulose-5-phosphate reductoisomerase|nr:1-deoxy-D-xylulose-5-phosphate reductoisomerase [Candidatus Cloacimonadota bacterium]MBT6994273.1 1-deoxy-D-xylulose-5-phosphate reductoisomerase [Candidatus Cloacimonadota bacterium]MBT7468973.1 1-deoxy-D-xylulose-5-phosphate reductoisomerase [Candidatus Cloacimonadota bacterium]